MKKYQKRLTLPETELKHNQRGGRVRKALLPFYYSQMKISILTPTRERSEKAKRFADSVLSTAAVPDDIELYFYVDDDDPQLKSYASWSLECPGNIHFHVGPAISVSKSWNSIAALCKGDILLMGNDDLIYRTTNWDKILQQTVLKYTDQIYVAWFNDGINGEDHCAFPAVSRKWYEWLGYFTPGIFEFIANDTWIFEIGKLLGRTIYIPEVYAEHRHFSNGKMEPDETTMRNRRDGRIQRDLDLFGKTKAVRQQDADKLLFKMK